MLFKCYDINIGLWQTMTTILVCNQEQVGL